MNIAELRRGIEFLFLQNKSDLLILIESLTKLIIERCFISYDRTGASFDCAGDL